MNWPVVEGYYVFYCERKAKLYLNYAPAKCFNLYLLRSVGGL